MDEYNKIEEQINLIDDLLKKYLEKPPVVELNKQEYATSQEIEEVMKYLKF